MPEVSEAFVKHAKVLAQATPELLDKVAELTAMPKEAAVDVRAQAEVVADTLIAQGLVKATEKSAAVEQLVSPKEALNILNRTAQQVAATPMGQAPHQVEKTAGDNSDGHRESDRVLLGRLGFSV